MRTDEFELNFESFFNENDAALAAIVSKIVQQESIETLSSEETKLLFRCIAYQIVLTKMLRTTLVSVQEQLKEKIEKEGWVSDIQVPTKEEAKLHSLFQLLGIDEVIKGLENKIMIDGSPI